MYSLLAFDPTYDVSTWCSEPAGIGTSSATASSHKEFASFYPKRSSNGVLGSLSALAGKLLRQTLRLDSPQFCAAGVIGGQVAWNAINLAVKDGRIETGLGLLYGPASSPLKNTRTRFSGHLGETS